VFDRSFTAVNGLVNNFQRAAVVSALLKNSAPSLATSFPVAGPREFGDSLPLQANLDRALHEAVAIGGDPHRHGAVALAHHTFEWNCDRAHGLAGADDEVRKHARAQFVLGIVDLGAHQHPMRRRIDRRADGGDPT
jgi:hypothetical protein